MKTNELLLAERKQHVPQGPFNTHPIFAAKAKGAIITDVEGKEYIDFAGGIGVNNVGNCNEEVISAVQDQIKKYIHTCFHVVMYEPYVELAKRLNEITPGNFPKKTMFANSGAEAGRKCRENCPPRHRPALNYCLRGCLSWTDPFGVKLDQQNEAL